MGRRTWIGEAGLRGGHQQGAVPGAQSSSPNPRTRTGGDCHLCGDTASHFHGPHSDQDWHQLWALHTLGPGQVSPDACNDPQQNGHHSALQRGHECGELPKATQGTAEVAVRAPAGLMPRPPALHPPSQPLLTDTRAVPVYFPMPRRGCLPDPAQASLPRAACHPNRAPVTPPPCSRPQRQHPGVRPHPPTWSRNALAKSRFPEIRVCRKQCA